MKLNLQRIHAMNSIRTYFNFAIITVALILGSITMHPVHAAATNNRLSWITDQLNWPAYPYPLLNTPIMQLMVESNTGFDNLVAVPVNGTMLVNYQDRRTNVKLFSCTYTPQKLKKAPTLPNLTTILKPRRQYVEETASYKVICQK